ncbi:MAG TPA: DUF456 domain-containing protein [Bacteroidia bacterium]|nr:DUF456 domain-containing protein [Bacteroidia bacterium]HNU33360.1 DUF456 domain-containing protein [Bacteroidia bacterium]
MEYFILSIAIVFTIVGVIGCVLPALPGLPFNYAALLMLQYYYKPFSTTFLVVMAVIMAVIMILDYFLPIWTAKKFGATKQGIWGSMIGMVLGIIFTPIGMLLGMFAGAVIGDMMAGKESKDAFKSGIATFFGTLFSIGLKLICAGTMSWYFFKELIKAWA